MAIYMAQYSPAKLNLATLLEIAKSRHAVIVSFQGVPFGLYIPCTFDEDAPCATPDWDEIEACVRHTREVCDIN